MLTKRARVWPWTLGGRSAPTGLFACDVERAAADPVRAIIAPFTTLYAKAKSWSGKVAAKGAVLGAVTRTCVMASPLTLTTLIPFRIFFAFTLTVFPTQIHRVAFSTLDNRSWVRYCTKMITWGHMTTSEGTSDKLQTMIS